MNPSLQSDADITWITLLLFLDLWLDFDGAIFGNSTAANVAPQTTLARSVSCSNTLQRTSYGRLLRRYFGPYAFSNWFPPLYQLNDPSLWVVNFRHLPLQFWSGLAAQRKSLKTQPSSSARWYGSVLAGW
jgi:hypothetical protein